jgi:glycosyltransferase involved in cell wall biosynthesis
VPTVTVAIPTRNRADLLPQAIDSALEQTFTDTEILVLDDASSDGTAEVVTRYDDPRLRYIRHDPNIGMAANWNYGYSHGAGEFVAVLHDDDYWAPQFLERIVAAFRGTPEAGFVYASVVPVDLDRRVIGEPPLSQGSHDRVDRPLAALGRLVRHTEVGWPAIAVRRACMLEVGGFTEDYPYHKDWAVWLQLAARHPVVFIAETLGYYRVHPGQFSHEFNRSGAAARDRYEMLREVIPTLPVRPAARRALLETAMHALAETQLVTAWDAARAGEREVARSEARFAFTIDRGVALRAPHLVLAAYLASWLPGEWVNRLNRWRARARPIFRRT